MGIPERVQEDGVADPLRAWWSSSTEEASGAGGSSGGSAEWWRGPAVQRGIPVAGGRGSHENVEAGTVSHEEGDPRRVGVPGLSAPRAQCPPQCERPHPRPHFPPPGRPSPGAPLPSPPSLPTLPTLVPPFPAPESLSAPSGCWGVRRSCSVVASDGAGRCRGISRGSVRPSGVRPSIPRGGGRCRVVRLSVMGCTPRGSLSRGHPAPVGSVCPSRCLAVHQDTSGCSGVCPFSWVSIYSVVCLSMGVSPYP